MLKKLVFFSTCFYVCLSFAGRHQIVELQIIPGSRIDCANCVEIQFTSSDFFDSYSQHTASLSYPKASQNYYNGPKNMTFAPSRLVGLEDIILKDSCSSIFYKTYRTPDEDGKLTMQTTVDFIWYRPENRKEFILSNCQMNWEKF